MTSVSISEFYDESDDAEIFKFVEVGDTAAGTVIRPPHWNEDRFNPGEKSLALTLDTGDGPRRLFLRKAQLRVLGKAVTDAGASTIGEGDWVSIRFADERDGRGAYPMRIWACDFKSAPSMGTGFLGETTDAFGDGTVV